MADLLTLNEYKTLVGIDPTDNRDDAKYSAAIPAASLAVRNYAERDFGAPLVTETRSYEYDGSGFLDIDDATEITKVEFIIPRAANVELEEEQWYAAPARRDDSPVFYYLVLTTPLGINPHMGFTRNLDVLWNEGRLPYLSRTAQVTGTWGWPTVPDDVKLAVVWTIQDWTTKPSGEGLTAESIEGYSRSWGNRAGASAALAIPNRARDILANYQKTLI
jgi:hypothetical protein